MTSVVPSEGELEHLERLCLNAIDSPKHGGVPFLNRFTPDVALKMIADLRSLYAERQEANLAINFATLARHELTRPITMQEVRLAVGEGKLSASDVLAGCNAEMARRRHLLAPIR
jgi:hypothetical protein